MLVFISMSATKNAIYNEMQMTIKTLKFLRLYSEIEDKRKYTVRYNHVVGLLIMILSMFIVINKIEMLLLYETHKLMIKILWFFYINTLAIKSFTFSYTIMTQKHNSHIFWSKLLKFDNYAKLLNLKPKSEKMKNALLLVLPNVTDCITKIIMIIKYTYPLQTVDIIMHSIAVYLRISELGMRFNYLILLSLYGNYFKQMVRLLKTNFKRNRSQKIFVLSGIAKCHQELIEITKFSDSIMGLHILGDLQELFILMVEHLYNFIIYMWTNDTYFDVEISICLVIQSIYYTFLLILPAVICKRYVSNLSIYFYFNWVMFGP